MRVGNEGWGRVGEGVGEGVGGGGGLEQGLGRAWLARLQKSLLKTLLTFLRDPVLPFLVFFFEKGQEKPPKKNKDSLPHRTPKIPGKEGKNARKNKEFLAREENKEFQKKGKEGQGEWPGGCPRGRGGFNTCRKTSGGIHFCTNC